MVESSFFPPMADTSHGPATTRCPVRLGLIDGRQVDAEIYLLPDAMRPGGVVTVEGTLDGMRDFIPVYLGDAIVLLSRAAIRTVEMSAEGPGTGDILEIGGGLDVVSLRLDSGETISGVLVTMEPVDTVRMSDVFNRHGRFLTLRDGDKLILVSKAHLVQASF